MSTDLMPRVLGAAEAAVRDEHCTFEDRPFPCRWRTCEHG
jgi:hypothetical protein